MKLYHKIFTVIIISILFHNQFLLYLITNTKYKSILISFYSLFDVFLSTNFNLIFLTWQITLTRSHVISTSKVVILTSKVVNLTYFDLKNGYFDLESGQFNLFRPLKWPF